MSAVISISTRRRYGVARVCRVWGVARSGVYRRRRTADAPPAVGWIVLAKLALHPLAVLLAVSLAPGVDETLLVGGVLFAAAPMMTIYPILGACFGRPWRP